ncbi:MAG: epoxide hydrolase [SAR202 cluster bacterium]|nr:epoxide hydrolase [Dehalococcoidia bacterium]MQF91480.1 epoxide hydrolase [SAR202 cluster bacterium]MQG71749.1 epoxide hydrolase [SAR202 cluster bacterium]|tara:strand:+ start:80 stop:1231 length:1152 start_codon:yes stop_codon:yes gene_type:complete
MAVQPYKIEIPDSVLDDLKSRLERTRWPDELPGTGWDYGSNLDYVKELVEYWRTKFDWHAQEKLINSFSHFKSKVDGLNIHFIHEKGKGPNPMPLVITHGWPGTFFEMYKVIPMLSDPASHGGDPADAFDVVAPSMPGYGFSDATDKRGLSVLSISDLWAKLMSENLGYQKFAAQGGDWGARVTAKLGLSHGDKVIGIHTTSTSSPTPYQGPGTRELSEAENAMLAQRVQWLADEGGYSHIQATKPQTLSYGLNDSPAGLAAWIVEKYRTWSDCGGDVESRFTKDELLTTITIYWVTQSINSSTRLYYESFFQAWDLAKDEKIQVPVAIASFPRENSVPLREWAERSFNIQQWTDMPSGGHFAALEEPDRLVEDIRKFFRGLR